MIDLLVKGQVYPIVPPLERGVANRVKVVTVMFVHTSDVNIIMLPYIYETLKIWYEYKC